MSATAPPPIDLRSDTVTRPTPAMREAIATAPVGDDVMGEDPTVARLQREVAALLGKEAALFMASGTMSNQVAIRSHCRPGDELLCEARCHIYNYEQGGFAQLSGVSAHAVMGEGGLPSLGQLQAWLRPDDIHQTRPRLLLLENTHGDCGGRVLPYAEVAALCALARTQGLATHLDGARLFNAVVASGIAAERWASHFDTINVCFSKGLGAPVGSLLVGSARHIEAARRHRKLFGGGMRQVGILAAGALHALHHHIPDLADDHRRAQALAATLTRCDGVTLAPDGVDTNIVIFRLDPRRGSAPSLIERLAQRGILGLALDDATIRLVTHRDLSDTDIERACAALVATLGGA